MTSCRRLLRAGCQTPVIAALAAAAATSCNDSIGGLPPSHGPETIGKLGELGRARFAISGRDEGRWRPPWIALDAPVMRSADGYVSADVDPNVASPWPDLLESTDPSVVELSPRGYGVADFVAKQPGFFQLRALADDGTEIDHVTVEVAPPAVLLLSLFDADGGDSAFNPSAGLAIRVGEVRQIDAHALDAEGRGLIVSDSIAWSLPDTSVCALRPFWFPDDVPEEWNYDTFDAESIDLAGVARGKTTVTVSADDLAVEIPVQVGEGYATVGSTPRLGSLHAITATKDAL